MAKGGYTNSVLSDAKKKKFQKHLSQYLKSHRHRNELTAVKAAEELQCSPIRYFDLEKEEPNGRFITSLDFLARIANIENLTISEFVTYLEENGNETSENSKLQKWQASMLNGFATVAIGPRKKFAEMSEELEQKNMEKLELIIQLAISLKDKPNTAIKGLVDAIDNL